MKRPSTDLTWFWLGGVACFVLAGGTDVLYRFGMLTGLPGGLQFDNVRHAHSHLMYFGWVMPALMALISSHLSFGRWARRVTQATLFLALMAYTPFLLYGYGLAQVGTARLPLSSMLAGANIVAWYVFAGGYVWTTRGRARTRTLRCWDAALAMLVFSSLGAWSLGVVEAWGPSNPFWFHAALDLFLDLFADGWLLLALLGLIYAAVDKPHAVLTRRGLRMIVMGLPVTFLLGVPLDVVPTWLRLVGGAGGLLVGGGLVLVLTGLWRADDRSGLAPWSVPLALLGAKAFAELMIAMPAAAAWADQMGLRILYLHVLLLGFVSLGLVAAAHQRWGQDAAPARRALNAAVLFLLATLLPLTGLWPAAWGGSWVVRAAAPLTAMIVLLVSAVYRLHRRSLREQPTTASAEPAAY